MYYNNTRGSLKEIAILHTNGENIFQGFQSTYCLMLTSCHFLFIIEILQCQSQIFCKAAGKTYTKQHMGHNLWVELHQKYA